MENGRPTKHHTEPSSPATSPIPVPDYIRTSRTMPRIFAVLTILVWAIIYVQGTAALSRRFENPQTITDLALKTGEHFWLLKRNASDTTCSGFVRTNVTTDPRLEFDISGASSLPIFGNELPVHFSLQAAFSLVQLLETLSGEIRAGEIRAHLESASSATLANISISSPTTERTFSVPLPNPIYVTETLPEHYSLRLPPDTESHLTNLRGRFPTVSGSQPADKTTADDPALATCKEQLENAKPSQAQYDLGSYLKLLGIDQESTIVQQLGTPQ